LKLTNDLRIAHAAHALLLIRSQLNWGVSARTERHFGDAEEGAAHHNSARGAEEPFVHRTLSWLGECIVAAHARHGPTIAVQS
jgi:hypothetical protein